MKTYTVGFLLSIILTVIPMLVVFNHLLPRLGSILLVMGTAILQLIIQLFFFMHIREGERPRYNVMALILGFIIVITIVAGSLWIVSFNAVVQ